MKNVLLIMISVVIWALIFRKKPLLPSFFESGKRVMERELCDNLFAIPDDQWRLGVRNEGFSFSGPGEVFLRRKKAWADGSVLPQLSIGHPGDMRIYLRGWAGLLEVRCTDKERRSYSPFVDVLYSKMCQRFQPQLKSLQRQRFKTKVGLLRF